MSSGNFEHFLRKPNRLYAMFFQQNCQPMFDYILNENDSKQLNNAIETENQFILVSWINQLGKDALAK